MSISVAPWTCMTNASAVIVSSSLVLKWNFATSKGSFLDPMARLIIEAMLQMIPRLPMEPWMTMKPWATMVAGLTKLPMVTRLPNI